MNQGKKYNFPYFPKFPEVIFILTRTAEQARG